MLSSFLASPLFSKLTIPLSKQRAMQTYTIDAYEKYSASALAASVVARSIAGTLLSPSFSSSPDSLFLPLC